MKEKKNSYWKAQVTIYYSGELYTVVVQKSGISFKDKSLYVAMDKALDAHWKLEKITEKRQEVIDRKLKRRKLRVVSAKLTHTNTNIVLTPSAFYRSEPT